MNFVCRVCRSWILRQRIHAIEPQLQRVAFAWSHDAVLARELADAAGHRVARDLSLFKQGDGLRIALYRALLDGYRQYQCDYSDVLTFAPAERMSIARKPMVSKVRRALSQLDPEQRLIVALIDLGGLSYGEIEQVLAISRPTLMKQICSARAWLKSQLFDSMTNARVTDKRFLWSSK